MIKNNGTTDNTKYGKQNIGLQNVTGAGTLKTIYKKDKKKKFTKKQLILYMFVAPSILLLLVFHYIPIYGLLIAFKDFKPFLGIVRSRFVGFYNFRRFLKDTYFWISIKNTIIFNLYSYVFVFPAPILFALFANEITNKKFKRTMQTISYLPHFLSWIIVSGMVYQILSPENGILNILRTALLKKDPVFYMTEVNLFRWIVTGVTVWKGVGWGAILYFATLTGIDLELYEAAHIDGANRFKQTIHITIPGLVPIMTLMFLLNLASLFSIDFDRIFLLQNPLVFQVSDVISTYAYRRGIVELNYGYSTAIGLTQSILGFITLTSANNIAKKLGGFGLY